MVLPRNFPPFCKEPTEVGKSTAIILIRRTLVPRNGMSRSFGSERLLPMKKPAHPLIAELPDRQSRVEMTIGIDLGDVWSHTCTLNGEGEVQPAALTRKQPHEFPLVRIRRSESCGCSGFPK